MPSTSFIDLRINTAEQFKESISEPAPNTKIYLAIGKSDAWANDNDPIAANSSISTVYEVWQNMIGGKRIVGSDIMHIIPRVNWTANSTYVAYDHTNYDLFNTANPFYVVTSQNAVYKCIANNNNSLSTVEPTSFNTDAPVTTSDGYIWKYMYTISSSELLRFTTEDYVPVKTIVHDDGSQQWDVQLNARPGSIEYIKVVSGGSGYTNSSNILVTVAGDGSPVIATANVSNGVIDNIIVTDAGLNYSFATVSINGGGGTGAQGRAIISPPSGHGANPVYELGGRDLMIDVRIRYGEEGVLPVTNDYRQIVLLKDPINRETNNVATLPAFSQMMEITTSGTGSYDQDEIVYQGSSVSAATFKGRVVWFDAATNKVYLINTTGTPTASRSLIGSESFTARVLASIEREDLTKYSGHILYVDNIEPVTRSSDQLENFKITLRF